MKYFEILIFMKFLIKEIASLKLEWTVNLSKPCRTKENILKKTRYGLSPNKKLLHVIILLSINTTSINLKTLTCCDIF